MIEQLETSQYRTTDMELSIVSGVVHSSWRGNSNLTED